MVSARVPVIGITTHSLSSVPGVRDGHPTSFAVGQAYVRAVGATGALAWPIPLTPDDPDLLDRLVGQIDGLLVPGGSDLDPAAYGEAPHPTVDPPDHPRDATELRLIRKALHEGMPVLGICRGMQALNVAVGGSLHQHVESPLRHDFHTDRSVPRDHLAHHVALEGGHVVREILGPGRLDVNSLHHQAVRDLGAGLVAAAFAPDGLVEAVEVPEHPFAVGVQWHPEELIASDLRMRALFRAFVTASVHGRGSTRTAVLVG